MGKRSPWKQDFLYGLGKRAWNSGFTSGIGKRAWNSGFTSNIYSRIIIISDFLFSGGMGKRMADHGVAGRYQLYQS